MTEGEPLLALLDRELADCRRRLDRLVDCTDALQDMHDRAVLIQARTKHRHVGVSDLEHDARKLGEEALARHRLTLDRITQEGTEER
ncbi:MAG: hypothetical protein H0U37_02795 [Chloroflexi bacterium]|nr:hypothetical protein [Chloroflexota bacterium]